MIEIISHYSGPTLLLGETGTGKNHFARELASKLKRKIVEVNLSTLTDQLFQSELFGHKRGAFTGADSDKDGLITCAQDGILFLDEIFEVDQYKQVKLLNFLQDRIYYPVGSTRSKTFNGIILCASNKDPIELLKNDKIREDFFYRLTGFTIPIAPLRERPKDIENIAQKLWKSFDFGFPLTHEFVARLKMMEWPGNVRELKYYLESYGLSKKFGSSLRALKDKAPINTFREAREEFEKNYLKRKLLEFDGRINLTAKHICVSKTTLIKKMKYYSLS